MVDALALAGKVALITGAARGQGREEALRFVEAGAAVMLGDVLDDEGMELAAELGEAAAFLRLDVSDGDAWTAFVDAACARFGRVDVLVNNAGISDPRPLRDTDEATFRRMIDVNLVGAFLGMRAVVPAMESVGEGSIVNVSSIAGIRGGVGGTAYSASKFGLRGITKVAAIELGPLGIRVNAILPGIIRTAMTAGMLDGREEEFASVPCGRIGRPRDVAEAVVWLASPASGFVTGIDLVVDGGRTVRA